MAFSEKYVTDAASGGDGSIGSPWTLAEALTNAVAGNRINILSDSGYSLGADTVSGVGTAGDLIVFRGYDSSIGDLQNPGRSSSTGSLITTGFPIITLTGTLTPNAFVVFQNLSFTGSISSQLVGSTSIDDVTLVESTFFNSANSSIAKAFRGDNDCRAVNCDFECTGADHGSIFDLDIRGLALYCRIKGVAGTGIALSSGSVVGNVFIGDGSDIAVSYKQAAVSGDMIVGNTIYNWNTAISYPNAAFADNPIIASNHVTDCSEYINNLRSATDAMPLIEMNNRTRDNTTPRTGVGDGVLSGEVTTDTGGIETDYTNAGADDLSLIAAAPGVDAGSGFG